MRRDDVLDAAFGASVIVHAVNPANYHNWQGLALPMLDNTIAAASLSRSTVVLPGSLYNYATNSSSPLEELAAQEPGTRKGAIRKEMEDRLRDASWDRIRTLIVRTGDYFGPHAVSSWFSQGVVRAGQPVRFAFSPGPRDQLHSWAYLPDVATTIVRLLDRRESMPAFETFHFKGHVVRNGDLLDALCRIAGISTARALPLPWWAMRCFSPWIEAYREMLELRYLWNRSLELDNRKLLSVLGSEPHTELNRALRETLVGIRCLKSNPTFPAQPMGSH